MEQGISIENYLKFGIINRSFPLILIIVIGFFYANFSFAQKSGTWQAGLETGVLRITRPNPFGFGILGATELKYNLRANMNVGMRTEKMCFHNNVSENGSVLSIYTTYDYYFPSKRPKITNFIGAGLGYFFYNGDYFGNDVKYNNPSFLLRAGFEIGKFKTSLTYRYIRTNAPHYDNVRDYISLTLGYYFGGGKRIITQSAVE